MSKQEGSSWRGSTDPAVEAGSATFRVGGHVVEVELKSFTEFRAIEGLLEASRRLGRGEAKATIENAVKRAMEDVWVF